MGQALYSTTLGYDMEETGKKLLLGVHLNPPILSFTQLSIISYFVPPCKCLKIHCFHIPLVVQDSQLQCFS